MPVPFLTARWSHLLLVNLEVPEAVLRPIIPAPLELDHWRGKAYVSVVGLCMDAVRVRGWRVPGFAAHAQVNFRTYVRLRDRAGVWFIRQLVASRLMAAVARWAYGEPFETAPIDARVADAPDTVTVEYRLARRWRMVATAGAALGVPRPGSAEAFFQERFVGYRLNRRGQLTAFQVEHPSWHGRSVDNFDWDLDLGALYGPEWAALSRRPAESVLYASGSTVAVYSPQRVLAGGAG
jgi:uncharacterized protein